MKHTIEYEILTSSLYRTELEYYRKLIKKKLSPYISKHQVIKRIEDNLTGVIIHRKNDLYIHITIYDNRDLDLYTPLTLSNLKININIILHLHKN